MKIIRQVILGCFVVLAISETQNALAQRYDTIRYARGHYNKRIKEFQKEPLTKGNIIFLGNSITEFGDWKVLLHDETLINRGIAGDNTFGVLERLDDVIIRQPSKLFIEVGINDLSQNIPVSIVVKNILAVVSRVRKQSPSSRIFIHGIFPTNDNVKSEYPDAFNKNHLVDSVNTELKKKASAYSYIYVDFATDLKGSDGKLNNKYAELDGLHLNQQGYDLWVKFLKSKKYL